MQRLRRRALRNICLARALYTRGARSSRRKKDFREPLKLPFCGADVGRCLFEHMQTSRAVCQIKIRFAVVMSSSRASARIPIAFEICPVCFPVVGKANLVETLVEHGSFVFGARR